MTIGSYMRESRHYLDFLMDQKKKGSIRHIGFSSHGKPETLKKFLEWGGDCFEFVQIQLNYLDWTMQDAKRQYEIITERGLPVWVMEPVRGGRLASLGKYAEAGKAGLEYSSLGLPLADGAGQCHDDLKRDEYDGPDP